MPDDNIDWQARQYEAAFVYARMDDSQTRDAVAGRAGDALVAQADFLLDRGSDTPFGYAVDPYAPYGWGNTAQQPWAAADHFARAHHLTGDQRYLTAMAEDMQYTLGANPLNSVFVTGFDDVRAPEGILNADADSMGGTPPSGITLYGDYNIFDYGTEFFHDVMYDDVWPNFWQTPVNESFNAFSVFVPSSEYTVQQGITDTTFTTGYLDAHSGPAGESFDVMSL